MTMDGWQDEETGSTDEMGWYGLFRGPLDAEDIDKHNDIVLSDERQKEEGYREYLLKAADVWDAMSAAGFIVEQHSSGAVYSTTYQTNGDLEAVWAQIEAIYTIEQCDECQAEAEEYGAGNPIAHEDGCSTGEEEEAA
jgi:hypothetical protein